MRHVFRYAVAEDPGAGREIALASEDAHHLTRVVRRGAGDPVELIGPDGRIWPAVVVTAGAAATVRATGEAREPAPPRVQAVARALWSFRRLWVRVINDHSPRTFASPRSKKCRKPRFLICPKGGSAITLRRE